MASPAVAKPGLEWGVVARAFAGGSACGDQYLVTSFPEGMLIAVVDGLGHGPEACLAAQTATMTLTQCAGMTLPDMLNSCHLALKRTRGAVLSLGMFHADLGTLSWLGVGNVEARLIRAGSPPVAGATVESLLLRAGVVGHRLPPMRAATLPVAPGDVLIFATDGIDQCFLRDLPAYLEPQSLAEEILRLHGKESDDALVLVARYRGEVP